MSSPVQRPQKGGSDISDFTLEMIATESAKDCSADRCANSELLSLQDKLAKALATGSPKPNGKKFSDLRVSSNCSLSTMAPDDASECGDLCSNAGMRRMPKVWSSGSVSSMVSWVDMADEEDEVEFELDIEAGAEAARQEETRQERSKTCEDVPMVPTAGRASPEMSHSQVPRNQNMAQMFDSNKNEPPTTMMIRNIPGRYSQNDLMLDLADMGFAGAYDFLYVPMDKGTAANVGYAFVNFLDSNWAIKCKQMMEGYRFVRHHRSSTKVATVSVAHLQGLEKNLQHYENAAVNMSRDKRRRPVVVPNIAKMFK
jgi:hypothetical protein